jgi:hypothetical protein
LLAKAFTDGSIEVLKPKCILAISYSYLITKKRVSAVVTVNNGKHIALLFFLRFARGATGNTFAIYWLPHGKIV